MVSEGIQCKQQAGCEYVRVHLMQAVREHCAVVALAASIEEKEVSIASGNWRGRHNSLWREIGAFCSRSVSVSVWHVALGDLQATSVCMHSCMCRGV